LVGHGAGCDVVRFLAEDGSRNLGLEFLSNSGSRHSRSRLVFRAAAIAR
jgi:hypothetical protein